MIKFTALLACGNYHGVVGYAKAKGPAVPIALQKVSICQCSSFFNIVNYFRHFWMLYLTCPEH